MKVFRFRFRYDFVFKPEFLNPNYMTFWHHPFFSHPSFRFQVRLYFFRSQFRIVKFFSAPNPNAIFSFQSFLRLFGENWTNRSLKGVLFRVLFYSNSPQATLRFPYHICFLVVLLHLNFYFKLYWYSVLINPIFRRLTLFYLKYSTINCLNNRIFV